MMAWIPRSTRTTSIGFLSVLVLIGFVSNISAESLPMPDAEPGDGSPAAGVPPLPAPLTADGYYQWSAGLELFSAPQWTKSGNPMGFNLRFEILYALSRAFHLGGGGTAGGGGGSVEDRYLQTTGNGYWEIFDGMPWWGTAGLIARYDFIPESVFTPFLKARADLIVGAEVQDLRHENNCGQYGWYCPDEHSNQLQWFIGANPALSAGIKVMFNARGRTGFTAEAVGGYWTATKTLYYDSTYIYGLQVQFYMRF